MSEPREDAYQSDPVDPAAKTQPAEGGVDEAETSIGTHGDAPGDEGVGEEGETSAG